MKISVKLCSINRLCPSSFDLFLLASREITHCARHTFATSVTLANKVTMENVAKMLGHSSTRMTQHYAKVLDQSILEDMMNVDNKLFANL